VFVHVGIFLLLLYI